MKKYCNEIFFQLEEKLNELSFEVDDPIYLSEIAIKMILGCLAELKKFILEREFKSDEEEIYFFKHLKPQMVSKLIYYNTIFKIETKRPFGGEKTLRKYLNKELEKLKRSFDNNLEFYKYYRTNSTYLDHKYFVRGKHDIKLSLDTFYFEADHSFSTSHDYKVAKILANDMIQVYLEDQLSISNQKKYDNDSLKWTGSKTALTELIYALYANGVFNNGNADIKVIAKVFESMFNIDLGDFYHIFMELKFRKINRTKFIDSLRDALIRKMDEQDGQ
ncbi:RteC domain-containing protein [Elizabethkingia anophelis]|uniref:RteC domain-containing protein n=1 Tax=Elizabethkingia anophelis TaxID=1117645 RepID=UPI001F4B195C|nr:RteC domain-containing protein [Elizabethkingia anophelis]MDV3970658.1 tetracycline regulation of excision, RteC [Elizabethkingia anophelis]